jgi:hypothetical protein
MSGSGVACREKWRARCAQDAASERRILNPARTEVHWTSAKSLTQLIKNLRASTLKKSLSPSYDTNRSKLCVPRCKAVVMRLSKGGGKSIWHIHDAATSYHTSNNFVALLILERP